MIGRTGSILIFNAAADVIVIDKEHDSNTVITKSMSIIGNIRSSNDLQIYGNIKGDVFSDRNVMVNGLVLGNIKAKGNVVVFGSVFGNISCDNLMLKRGDLSNSEIKVKGKVQCRDITILGKLEGNAEAREKAVM